MGAGILPKPSRSINDLDHGRDIILSMSDIFKKLRDEAAQKAERRAAERSPDPARVDPENDPVMAEVADLTGLPVWEVAYCCGAICPHCETFLDKAIALVDMGHPHHLFMNPVQQERFAEALALYRRDRKEYDLRKPELIASMRR